MVNDTTTPIAAKPTRYAGIQFRSRLEARWAAFFDQLGWRWEYEPFDADGYIPDFILLGDMPVLVEVKPAASLREMEQHQAKIDRTTSLAHPHDALIVGVSPFMGQPECWNDEEALGWLGEHKDFDDNPTTRMWGAGVWMTCGKCGITTFHHEWAWYASRLCGHADGDGYLGAPDLAFIRAAWAEARNAVQWQPPK